MTVTEATREAWWAERGGEWQDGERLHPAHDQGAHLIMDLFMSSTRMDTDAV